VGSARFSWRRVAVTRYVRFVADGLGFGSSLGVEESRWRCVWKAGKVKFIVWNGVQGKGFA